MTNDEREPKKRDARKAKEPLRASEKNCRLIINRIPGFVSTSTPSGVIEFVNQQVLEYFGKSL